MAAIALVISAFGAIASTAAANGGGGGAKVNIVRQGTRADKAFPPTPTTSKRFRPR